MAAAGDPIEPVPDRPAAIVDTGSRNGECSLVVADYHAGLEVGLRREGVSVPSRAADRRERLLRLLDMTGAERVVFLGDLAHAIGDPGEEEREELETLLGAVTERASAVVVKGNHDGGIKELVERAGIGGTSVTPTDGTRLGSVGFAHGHTWPAAEVIEAPLLCIGHEHPTVRLTDSVGGRRVEPIWLRGDLDRSSFDAHDCERTGAEDNTEASDAGRTHAVGGDGGDGGETGESGEGKREAEGSGDGEGSDGNEPGDGRSGSNVGGELVVFPAFNDLVGGTWVNVPEQGFLAPFLPEGLAGGEAYLLDGTRLGDYRRV
jgi:putative SbcD/Mre11-related phosphoesterase